MRGCTSQEVERVLQPAVQFGNGGFVDNCPDGSFSLNPGSPCVACLSCSRNASPLVQCVTNAADVTQCECDRGFRSNGRGGCPPDRTIGSGSLDNTGACAVGQFRPNPNGPCFPCLSCGANAFPRTNCVIDRNDLGQCGCHAGYSRSNGVCVPVGGGSIPPATCAPGTFRSSPGPNAPCVPCLSCAWNAFALTSCVQNTADPAQCQCKPGFRPNGRGGCLPTPTVGGGTLEEQQQPCETGYFRSSPERNAPCIRCLSCARNAFARTNCVQNAADPAQCQCKEGFRPNGRGGCLRVTTGGGSIVCPTGYFRSSPESTSLCIPCLRCGSNAFARVNCVQNAADPNQCVCGQGYRSNGRGGCLPNIGSGSVGDCAVGYFRSSPESTAPCVRCLTCARNAFPKTNCVRNTADAAQCECHQGYTANGRGGCLPAASAQSFENSATESSGTMIGYMMGSTLLLAIHLFVW